MFDFLKRNGYRVDNFHDHLLTQDLIEAIHVQWSTSEKLKELHTFIDLKESLFHILDDFEYDSLRSSKPLPGCLQAIQQINEAGIQTGIVTNSGRGPVISILSDFGYLPYMEVVVTRNEMARMKPRADGLLEAKRLFQLETEDFLYVGDSVLDIQAAREAGMKCASIATGLHTTETLQKMAPDYFLESMQDLERLVLPNRS